MKKLLLIVFAICSFATVNAQTCKIVGSTDNSSIEVINEYWEKDSTYAVFLSNDSSTIAANVTVTIEVTYKYGSATKTAQFSGKCKVIALGETKCQIPVPPTLSSNSNYKADSASIISITGNKCQ